ncbi:tyrosine-type recombinase/integrase [Rhodococcus sp. IEGM 1406]|uniref:tyrosine-type recombinase/integrase n=1 Tax=Rhodococcus sp. IEGM 1406 TaxID=3047083 RepID=UPI0024B74211|nr:tyrosine-type recombinase/integrase [Rhodococcus sp. IEGM 1406]MDI9907966.1 tyrosine-type recombinase/integrase [Rhodococcus sp. IEGM 1406]
MADGVIAGVEPVFRASATPEQSVESFNQIAAMEDSEFAKRYRAFVHQKIRAQSSVRAYETGWRHFVKWCSVWGFDPLPANEIALLKYMHYWGDPDFIRAEGESYLSASTLSVYVVGIKWMHIQSGNLWPTVKSTSGDSISDTRKLIQILQRDRRRAPLGKALLRDELLEAVALMESESRLGRRNRALLLTTFYGAFRRSEVVGLRLGDLDLYASTYDHESKSMKHGMTINLRYSKTDRRGAGSLVQISATNASPCPHQAMKDWIDVCDDGPADGPIFTRMGNRGRPSRSPFLNARIVNDLVKGAVVLIGKDPTRYSAHSLRSGFITSAFAAEVPAPSIKTQSRHASYEMLDRYNHNRADMAGNAVSQMDRNRCQATNDDPHMEAESLDWPSKRGRGVS